MWSLFVIPFSWVWQTRNQGKLLLQLVNSFGISHFSSNRWFYQDDPKDCVLMYSWKELHCNFQLNNTVFSARVLLSPNAFFFCVSASSANATFFMLSKHVSYTEHLYTLNRLYIWLCSHKFVLSACCFDLLLFNTTCSLSLLANNGYTAFPTILFFKMCH